MLFHAKNKPAPANFESIHTSSMTIERVKSVRYLGLMLNQNFYWNMHTDYIHYRQKIWNNFHLSDFLVFCGVCRVFLYLIYIPRSRYYFGEVNLHSIAEWTAKVQKQLFLSFFFSRHWLEFLLCHCQIAGISVRVLIRYIMHNIIVYLPPRLVRSAGD